MASQNDKKELLEELLELNQKYLIIHADFRTKNVNGVLKITEFFPSDAHSLHGNFDEQLLWDWYNVSDDVIGEYLRRVGFYTCLMMFSFDSDGDGFGTWVWLDLEAVKIDNFRPLEIKLKEEYEWASVTVADSESDDLPF